jgi:soluble lytic murein transglycosylase-like protein
MMPGEAVEMSVAVGVRERLPGKSGRRPGRASLPVLGLLLALGFHTPAVAQSSLQAPSDVRVAAAPEANETAPPNNETPSAPRLDGRANYRALIEKEAAGTGLAPDIAEAVMAVESGYNPAAIGGVGEIGLMQILPSTARMLGFVGSNADLAVPATNIHYGVSYLAQAWRLAGGDLCTAVMKYRAGHGETRFSYLSVNYCLAVRSKLAARGFPVTGNVPVATFGEAASGGLSTGRPCGAIGTKRIKPRGGSPSRDARQPAGSRRRAFLGALF